MVLNKVGMGDQLILMEQLYYMEVEEVVAAEEEREEKMVEVM